MYDKPKFNEKYLGLPDFVTMTNLVQGRGYFIDIIINEGKFVGTITHKGRTQVTKKSFNKSLDAQKYTASEMFLMLKDLHDK
jgi:hypothetical protein|tara:strand:- start:303 stop:548 length:246 start_codon:yes stop_codon:yes gene_type:complete